MKNVLVWAIFAVMILSTGVYGSNSPIKIGADYELSGAVASFGKSCVNAIKLYFDQVNSGGGVLGRKIELVTADNQSNPKAAADLAGKLIEKDKVAAILGPVTSRDCLGAAQVAQYYGVVLLTATATNPAVTEAGDYIFRACFLDAYQGTIMARFALEKLNIQSAAIVSYNEPGYSRELAQAFKEAFIKGGGRIAAEETIPSGTKDCAALVQKVAAAKPGAIFAPIYYQEAGLLAKTARDQNIQLPILGGDGWDSSDLTKVAGKTPLNNIYFCNHYSADNPDPQNAAFAATYLKKYWSKPDALSGLAYDTAAMIVQAITEAGDPEPAKIREAMVHLKFKGVSGNLIFDAKRNPVKTGVVTELKDGKQGFNMAMDPETTN